MFWEDNGFWYNFYADLIVGVLLVIIFAVWDWLRKIVDL